MLLRPQMAQMASTMLIALVFASAAQAWSPADLPGGFLILSSNTGVTANANNTITAWRDQSRIGNHPRVRPSQLFLWPGQEGVVYTGIGSALDMGATRLRQPFTLLSLLHIDSRQPSVGASQVLYRSAGGTHYALRRRDTGAVHVRAGGVERNTGLRVPADRWVELIMVVDGPSSYIEVDGVRSEAFDPGSTDLEDRLVLTNNTTAGAASLGAWIAELYVIEGTLSSSDRARVDAHFDARAAALWRVGRAEVVTGNDLHNAFPGLARLRNGDLVAVYRRGPDHIASGNGVICMKIWSNATRTWGAERVIDNPGPGRDARDPSIMRTSSGALVVTFYRDSNARGTSRPYSIRSTDNGASWSALAPISTSGFDWAAIAAPAVETRDGDLLAFVYGDRTGVARSSSAVIRSTDAGVSWTAGQTIIADGTPEAFSYQEPFGVICSDGSLLVLMRGSDQTTRQVRSTAGDAVVWGPVTESGFRAHSRVAMASVGGSIVAAYRTSENARYVIAMRSSPDNGATWSEEVLPVADHVTMAYAALEVDAAGRLRCLYAREWSSRRSDLKWFELRAEEIRRSRPPSRPDLRIPSRDDEHLYRDRGRLGGRVLQ